jgi:hypothetical protein
VAIGMFVDKKHQPTMKEVFSAIGAKRLLWESLTQFIADNYGIKGDFAFYGKNYGWAIRFREAGKALLSMYPGKNGFTVQIVIGQTHAEKVFDLNLGEKVKKILRDAHQFREGRWLFIAILSKRDLEDVQQLLRVKLPPVSRVSED